MRSIRRIWILNTACTYQRFLENRQEEKVFTEVENGKAVPNETLALDPFLSKINRFRDLSIVKQVFRHNVDFSVAFIQTLKDLCVSVFVCLCSYVKNYSRDNICCILRVTNTIGTGSPTPNLLLSTYVRKFWQT